MSILFEWKATSGPFLSRSRPGYEGRLKGLALRWMHSMILKQIFGSIGLYPFCQMRNWWRRCPLEPSWFDVQKQRWSLCFCSATNLYVRALVYTFFLMFKLYKCYSRTLCQLQYRVEKVLRCWLNIKACVRHESKNWKCYSKRPEVGCLILSNVCSSPSLPRVQLTNWRLTVMTLRRQSIVLKNLYSI